MKYIFAAALACITAFASAQDFDHYKTILPQGEIPKDFTELASLKVAAQIESSANDNVPLSRRESRRQKTFFLESTFNVGEFLAGGKVLFNDEISLYLNDVLKELVKPYPALQNKIRIYAVKSSHVNAFTTNNGIIFVNLGLLSRLENEAQLAYVLSHEIVHFQKQHVLNKYMSNVEVDRSRDYRKLSAWEKGVVKNTFSKEMESEADLEGLKIYLSGAWSKDSVANIFNTFGFADCPYLWTRFKKTTFESGKYIFPDTVNVEKVRPMTFQDDYDDEMITHPNIKKRKESIISSLKGQSGGKDFIVSNTRFYNVRKISRYELCRLYLIEHMYAESIALSLSLKTENPTSTYLNESIAKGLYGLAKFSLSGIKLQFDTARWIGESQRVSAFFERQSPYEICVLAIRELYKCKEKNQSSAELALMLNDLMRSFGKEYEKVKDNFLRTPSQKEITGLDHGYTQYAFLDFQNVNQFFTTFDKESAAKNEVKPWTRKKKKAEKKKSLKVNKVVIVSPMYKSVDARRRRRKIDHMKGEDALLNINDKIDEAASLLNMKADVINLHKLSRRDLVMAQNNSIIGDWIHEQSQLNDEIRVSPIYNEVIALADSYKTDHFVWMGNMAIRTKKRGRIVALAGTALFPALAPWALAKFCAPTGGTLYYAIALNVRTQEVEFADVRTMAMRDSEALLRSNIYYTLSRLKK